MPPSVLDGFNDNTSHIFIVQINHKERYPMMYADKANPDYNKTESQAAYIVNSAKCLNANV